MNAQHQSGSQANWPCSEGDDLHSNECMNASSQSGEMTFVLAVLLLVSSNLTFWLTLVFPAWIFVISVFILIVSLRAEQAQAEGIVGSKEGS